MTGLPPVPPTVGLTGRVRLARDYYVRVAGNDYSAHPSAIGRYVDFAVIEATPRIFYAATGSGGLWKTEDHGIHWRSIFDNQPVVTIGAVALSQTNPSVISASACRRRSGRSVMPKWPRCGSGMRRR